MTYSFPQTDWTFFLSQRSSSEIKQGVQNRFYQDYHPPIRSFIQFWLSEMNWRESDADDLTQEFFNHLFKGNKIQSIDPQKGKLRSFLITCVKNFLINCYREDQSKKRGGSYEFVDLDHESVVRTLDSTESQPDKAFDRHWARRIVELALKDLETEYLDKGQKELFETIRPQLVDRGKPEDYQLYAEKLNKGRAEIGKAVFYMRRRFRDLISNHLARTVFNRSEYDEEFKYLKQLLSDESALDL